MCGYLEGPRQITPKWFSNTCVFIRSHFGSSPKSLKKFLSVWECLPARQPAAAHRVVPARADMLEGDTRALSTHGRETSGFPDVGEMCSKAEEGVLAPAQGTGVDTGCKGDELFGDELEAHIAGLDAGPSPGQ